MTDPRMSSSSTGAPGDISTDTEALTYKMAMALNAADLGDPICGQAASICAEIAAQHCAEVHLTATVPLVSAAADRRRGLEPVAT